MEDIQKEPAINIPPSTLLVSIVLLAIFAALQKDTVFEWLVPRASFIPADFKSSNAYTLLSYALLHFGWAHIITNVTGLLAFGSGVERLLGVRKFWLVFIGGIVLGALGHYALFPHSTDPLGGASAGISALFGCALPLMVRKRDLVIANVVFVLTNLLIGMMGMPGEPGLSIAWQAHIVGFLFGEVFVLITLRSGKE